MESWSEKDVTLSLCMLLSKLLCLSRTTTRACSYMCCPSCVCLQPGGLMSNLLILQQNRTLKYAFENILGKK